MHTVPLRKAQPHDTRNMVHVRQRGHTDQPGSWELASWIRQGGMSAQMSRGWPTELARAIYGRRDALAKKADFPGREKG